MLMEEGVVTRVFVKQNMFNIGIKIPINSAKQKKKETKKKQENLTVVFEITRRSQYFHALLNEGEPDANQHRGHI